MCHSGHCQVADQSAFLSLGAERPRSVSRHTGRARDRANVLDFPAGYPAVEGTAAYVHELARLPDRDGLPVGHHRVESPSFQSVPGVCVSTGTGAAESAAPRIATIAGRKCGKRCTGTQVASHAAGLPSLTSQPIGSEVVTRLMRHRDTVEGRLERIAVARFPGFVHPSGSTRHLVPDTERASSQHAVVSCPEQVAADTEEVEHESVHGEESPCWRISPEPARAPCTATTHQPGLSVVRHHTPAEKASTRYVRGISLHPLEPVPAWA